MGKNFKIAAVALIATAALTSNAVAGEGMFQRTYTTDTTPAGQFEFEQLLRDRNGRSFGDYNAVDSATELEYGFTDDFQGALYINTGRIDARHSPDDDDPNGATGFTRHSTEFQGASTEFLWRLSSPYKDGFGFALYAEPEWGVTDRHNGLSYDNSYGLETKAIFQKNFLDDRLIVAYNLAFEFEQIRFTGEDRYTGELDWDNDLGVTYRFAPNWFAGVEGHNHHEYGDFQFKEHNVYWAGPVLHYGGEKYWATLGVMEQVYGSPSGTDENGTNIGTDDRFLRSHEKTEVTFKIGIPFSL